MFFLGTILIWLVFDRLLRANRARNLIRKATLGVVIVLAILPFFRKNVEYVFSSWKPVFEELNQYKDTDSVVDYASLFVLYDCVNTLDKSASILPVKGSYSMENSNYPLGSPWGSYLKVSLPDLPQTFLYWMDISRPSPEIRATIIHRGYKMSKSFEWGDTKIYVCEKRKR